VTAAIQMFTLRTPLNSGHSISDYPKSFDDFDCSIPPHLPNPSSLFFSGSSSSKRVLVSMFSRLRGYHRTLLTTRHIGQRLCRLWRVHWDEPYSSSEHRVFQYPPGIITPAAHETWGEFLMWIESKSEPLTIVDVE